MLLPDDPDCNGVAYPPGLQQFPGLLLVFLQAGTKRQDRDVHFETPAPIIWEVRQPEMIGPINV